MNPQRWQKINELFQEAISLAPRDRGDFLNQACLNDDELRHEIETLLDEQAEDEHFFERAMAQGSEARRRADTQTENRATAEIRPDESQTENRATVGVAAAAETAREGAKTGAKLLPLTAIGVAFIGALNLLMGWLALKYGSTERVGIEIENRIGAPVVRDVNPNSP